MVRYAVVLVLILQSFLSSGAFAAPIGRCESVFASPVLDLEETFAMDQPGLRAWYARWKTSRVNFLKPKSADEIKSLLVSLADARLGSELKWRDLLKDDAGLSRRLLRLQQIEVGRRGLMEYYSARGLLRDKSRLIFRVRKLLSSKAFQAFMAANSLISILAAVPVVRAPQIGLFKVSPGQMETLLIYGMESPEGHRVMTDLMPAHARDLYTNLFVRSFNRLSALVSLYFLYQYLDKIDKEATDRNGAQVLAAMDLATDKIEREAKSPADTKEDIHFDETARYLEETYKRDLTKKDLRQLCHAIAAPNRCG